MKKNNEKKDKIKKTLLKILHVVSYVLSFGFIIVCILVGVGSCNNKKSHDPQRQERQVQERINIEGQYKYFLDYKPNIPTQFSDWDDYILTLTTGCQIFTYNQVYNVTISVGDSMVLFGNEVIKNQYQSLRFEYWYDNSNNILNLGNFFLYDDVNQNYLFIYGSSTSYQYRPVSFYIDSLNWAEINLNAYPSNDDFNINNFVGLYFDIYENEGLQYYFDVNQINPIEFYSYEILNTNVAHMTGSWTGHIDLNMFFESNGILFNSMRFQYDYVLGVYANGEKTIYSDFTYLALTYIAYQDAHSGDWVKVAYPRIYEYESRHYDNDDHLVAYPFTDFRTYLWVNDGYKNINIIYGADNVFSTAVADPIAYLTNWQVLNYKGTYNNVYISGNGNTNVFSLLGSAFNSIGGLFTIVLLPGITIGTLLFLPLVVLIIFAIIKIIHK